MNIILRTWRKETEREWKREGETKKEGKKERKKEGEEKIKNTEIETEERKKRKTQQNGKTIYTQIQWSIKHLASFKICDLALSIHAADHQNYYTIMKWKCEYIMA